MCTSWLPCLQLWKAGSTFLVGIVHALSHNMICPGILLPLRSRPAPCTMPQVAFHCLPMVACPITPHADCLLAAMVYIIMDAWEEPYPPAWAANHSSLSVTAIFQLYLMEPNISLKIQHSAAASLQLCSRVISIHQIASAAINLRQCMGHCQCAAMKDYIADAQAFACSNVMIIATGTRPALDPLGPFSVDYQVTNASLR